jgi:hypothetical protein
MSVELNACQEEIWKSKVMIKSLLEGVKATAKANQVKMKAALNAFSANWLEDLLCLPTNDQGLQV